MTKRLHFTPYIEITKKVNPKGQNVYQAILWYKDDYWPGPEYTEVKTKATTMLNTKNHFLERVRRLGKALKIDVEENF